MEIEQAVLNELNSSGKYFLFIPEHYQNLLYLLYSFVFLNFLSLFGLFFFKNWARIFFTVISFFTLALFFFPDYFIFTGLSFFIYNLLIILNIVIIVFLYKYPIKIFFGMVKSEGNSKYFSKKHFRIYLVLYILIERVIEGVSTYWNVLDNNLTKVYENFNELNLTEEQTSFLYGSVVIVIIAIITYFIGLWFFGTVRLTVFFPNSLL